MLHTTGAGSGNHEFELFRASHGAGEEVRASVLTCTEALRHDGDE